MWDPDIPFTTCPGCNAIQGDVDEFDFIKCDNCDYCIHPSAQIADDGKNWICDVCGEKINDNGELIK